MDFPFAFLSGIKPQYADVSLLRADVSLQCADVSLLRGDVSLPCTDVSLLRADVSLQCADVSLLRGDVSLPCSDVSLQCKNTNILYINDYINIYANGNYIINHKFINNNGTIFRVVFYKIAFSIKCSEGYYFFGY